MFDVGIAPPTLRNGGYNIGLLKLGCENWLNHQPRFGSADYVKIR